MVYELREIRLTLELKHLKKLTGLEQRLEGNYQYQTRKVKYWKFM